MKRRQKYIVPLSDQIESKFGSFMAYFKTNEGRYYLYKYLQPFEDGTSRLSPESFLIYDEQMDIFRFNGQEYSRKDFIKVMNLLVFV